MPFSKILCILCGTLPYFSACEAEKWMEMCSNYESTTQISVRWLKPLYLEFSSPSVPQTLFYGCYFQSNLYLWQVQWRYHKSQQCCYVGLSRGRLMFWEGLLGGLGVSPASGLREQCRWNVNVSCLSKTGQVCKPPLSKLYFEIASKNYL